MVTNGRRLPEDIAFRGTVDEDGLGVGAGDQGGTHLDDENCRVK